MSIFIRYSICATYCTLSYFLFHSITLLLRRPPIALAQIHQPLRFHDFCLHLHDQYLQLLLALLAGVGIDIAGVLLPSGHLGE